MPPVIGRLVLGCLIGCCGSIAAGATVEVIGKSGGVGHRWEDAAGNVSPPAAALGKPDGRLLIKVNNGDVVHFRVVSGTHAVIFEQAKKEMDAGVWAVVADSGELGELPATFKTFDRANARKTPRKAGPDSTLIKIEIKNLKAGESILFACDPHSTGANPDKQPMLGALVLADTRETKKTKVFTELPQSETCRLIDFDKAQVVPGIITDTYFLVVSGTKPCINMEVRLIPRVYVRRPEYWGIEVVGCLTGGICLPVTAPYSVAIPLEGITGTKGVEAIGASTTTKLAVPPK